MNSKYLLILRVFLISAAIAWGVSVFGLVLPWSVVDRQLTELGAESITDGMVQYWLKMAAAVYTLLGIFYVMIAINPAKYKPVINLVGIGHIILGIAFLINGLMIGIDAIPLYVDVSFCLVTGIGILVTNRRLKESFNSMNHTAKRV